MGCDIHLYVEKKDKSGKWVTADNWDKTKDVDYERRFYSSRNYSLFAILADVRNECGLAAKYGFSRLVPDAEDDIYIPISAPRGLPCGATPEVRAAAEHWEGDGHSYSWLLLSEILAYDWTQVVTRRGWLSVVEYWAWNRWGRYHGEQPKSWCVSVGGGGVKHLTAEAMTAAVDSVLSGLPKDAPYATQEQAIISQLGGTYAMFEWQVSYYQACAGFWGSAIPKLLHLGNPEDIRLVFWFDN
jgi:hypothetical protein